VITDIITAVGEMAIGDTVCRYLDTAKMDVAAGDLPVRIIVPVTEAAGEFVAIGNLSAIEWRIHDVLLYAAVTQGSGIHQFTSEMATYIEQYITALKANRVFATTGVLVGWEFRMGPIAWSSPTPDYWGVDIALVIEEHI